MMDIFSVLYFFSTFAGFFDDYKKK